ncbi:hypothetical protein LTR99_003670 [Exophiala xenobiotica]|uniref:D-xylose 1-dehydrogenase (NADP(+), D-xylono-1,5-lactone-forming) n=1 Tax=Vermiconidia calcicola TaxID=1690605 RepID=A0AAV9PY09_9PEZI|nr:hypothetical protein H2202_008704 [Exophiala xenobiotica]KAK5531365.1 hypothetical protein LTR25_008472 [Vermiconidia calcicola]KAK5540570.1 hypothetical protein LTR23_006031 [Chaetothyriales sp. CCFEE 6169]KAK5191502.1 hypothetical protein LTR92_008675 [Exophiala xenobiotica]KAK5218325.1 hypothetical protein LTR72_008928 [Exophiala xenobiotica]
MATGFIAQTFAKDILIDPNTRKVTDVRHVVSAVASSSSKSAAEAFIGKHVAPTQSETQCTPYGSYEELVKDPNVDIIYIGTPHSHHYQNAMLALKNNKPVLCEKALTVNASQARRLYDVAKEKHLFFMDGVWTRHVPISKTVRQHIINNDIGEVIRVSADLSIGVMPEDFEVQGRMVNPDLAGGCLLDLGIYSLSWVFQTMFHTLPPPLREDRPSVLGTAMTFTSTGVDESVVALLDFPKSTPTGKTKAHGIVTAAMRITDSPAGARAEEEVPTIRIQGEKGEIQMFGRIHCPTRYKLLPKEPNQETIDRTFEMDGAALGLVYEADAAARALVAGKLESEIMTWAESTLVMEVMDQIRHQGGLTYPEAIETTEYPVKLYAKSS